MSQDNKLPLINFHKNSGGLSLIWTEDDQCYLSGDFLRRACRCASCRAAQIQDNFHPGSDIKVTDVKPFGVAGLQLFFRTRTAEAFTLGAICESYRRLELRPGQFVFQPLPFLP